MTSAVPADFDAVVRTGAAPLTRLAYLITANAAAAEDVVQEACRRLWTRWTRDGAPDDPAAYLRMIVVNEARRQLRKQSQDRDLVGSLSMAAASFGYHDIEVRDDREALWTLLADLSSRQRSVLVLRYYENLGDREIADILGCRPATVRSLAARALTRLKERSEELVAGRAPWTTI